MRKEYANWHDYENQHNMTKNKQPKNLSTMAVKRGGDKVTRQMKRHATISVDGKRVPVLEFMSKQSKKPPVITNKETGKAVDHYEVMKAIYMKEGIDGVSYYLETCLNVYRRDTGNWIQRTIAKWKLRKFRKK